MSDLTCGSCGEYVGGCDCGLVAARLENEKLKARADSNQRAADVLAAIEKEIEKLRQHFCDVGEFDSGARAVIGNLRRLLAAPTTEPTP